MIYAYTRPRYQMSVYRTIGPLVLIFSLKHRLWVHRLWVHNLCFEQKLNQRTNDPVNANLISGPRISTHIQILNKMAEQTLTLITHNPSFTHSVYYINQIQVTGCNNFKKIHHCLIFPCKSLSCKI